MAVKDLSVTLKDLNGVEVKEADKIPTVQSLVISALLGVYQDEQNLSGEDKFKRFSLATKINTSVVVDLTPEEIVLIKMLIGKGYGALVVGQIYNLLNA